MKLKLLIDTENQQDLIDASLLLNYYLKPGNKTAAAESLKKAPATAKKKAAPIVEDEELEENFEEEPSFDEEENFEEEPSFDEEENEEEPEEEEEKPTPKKKAAAPATKSSAKSAPATGSKLKLEDVVTQCGVTHKKLKIKLKSTEKAQAKINAVIKAHGAKSTRTLDAKKYAAVIKDLKALAA